MRRARCRLLYIIAENASVFLLNLFISFNFVCTFPGPVRESCVSWLGADRGHNHDHRRRAAHPSRVAAPPIPVSQVRRQY